jgi:hypothetical protein
MQYSRSNQHLSIIGTVKRAGGAAIEFSGGPRLRFLSVGVLEWFLLSAESSLANIVT